MPTSEQIAEMPIRERLHYWTQQNDSSKTLRGLLPDSNILGTISNNISRTQTMRAADLNNLKPGPSGSQSSHAMDFSSESDEYSIVGTDTSKPGDLVEVRNSGSRMPILAVYLGFFGDRNHFYSSTGLWHTSRGFSSLFTVSNFATADELAPILQRLPADATLQDFEKIKEEDIGPSREDAKAVIEKMHDFSAQAEAVYQTNVNNLGAALNLLSKSDRVRYLSLFQMAEILLPKSVQEHGETSPAALYAVHTALTRNEFGFQPISSSRAIHRRDQLYEVFPREQTAAIDRVSQMVRDHVSPTSRPRSPRSASKDTKLGAFLDQARVAIETSRKVRETTVHGILKPSAAASVIQRPEWSPASQDVILFLEMWASYGMFESSPRLHSNGAMILRLLGTYSDLPLNQTTAWTFLQEIGHIMPWEVPSRYNVRFPGTEIIRGGGLQRPEPSIQESTRPDVASGARQDIDAPVFCIDGVSTTLIDDGISVERTDDSKEFWIHVHAADPASGIQPNSELCKYMELIPDNIYLPGHFQAMLPAELGMEDGDYQSKNLIEKYSLHNGAPALTFSAKVNRQGDVLDYKVTPSTLQNVIYMEPDDVSRFCLEPREKHMSTTRFSVGQKPDESSVGPERAMVRANDLDKAMQDDVVLLYELTNAIKDKRLKKGAWPYFFPRPTVKLELGAVPDVEPNEIAIPADPYIEVSMESSNGSALVSNSMVLAGEIAARWCADRNISVPYRRDALEGREHYAALMYAQEELYPLIKKGIEPTASQRSVLARLTGGIELASQPGPYFMLGLDMYAKATSPLRRFGDLLVHWQIHAALAHERSTGRKLDGAKDNMDEIMAFSNEQLADTLPLLQLREKLGRAVARGTTDWMRLALLRAWQFDKTLPNERMVFTVDMRLREGLMGHLDMFGLDAVMDVDGLNQQRLMNDVRVTDQFEVELADINVRAGQVLVKALRPLSRPEELEKPAPEQQQQ